MKKIITIVALLLTLNAFSQTIEYSWCGCGDNNKTVIQDEKGYFWYREDAVPKKPPVIKYLPIVVKDTIKVTTYKKIIIHDTIEVVKNTVTLDTVYINEPKVINDIQKDIRFSAYGEGMKATQVLPYDTKKEKGQVDIVNQH